MIMINLNNLCFLNSKHTTTILLKYMTWDGFNLCNFDFDCNNAVNYIYGLELGLKLIGNNSIFFWFDFRLVINIYSKTFMCLLFSIP